MNTSDANKNLAGDSKTQATDPARKGKAIQEHAKQWPPKTKEEHFAGDSEFKTSRNTRPMLALTLTIRNKVNSAAVGRPENLTTDDAWKVEYSFSEIQNARQAWALYEATKKRRADILDEDIFSYPMHEFKKQVSEWVKKGREWRVEQDKLDEEKGERVIFEPYDRGVEAEQVHEVEEEVTSSAPEADAPSQTPEKGATARKVLSLSARRRSKDREKARMAKEARQLARRYPSETDV